MPQPRSLNSTRAERLPCIGPELLAQAPGTVCLISTVSFPVFSLGSSTSLFKSPLTLGLLRSRSSLSPRHPLVLLFLPVFLVS